MHYITDTTGTRHYEFIFNDEELCYEFPQHYTSMTVLNGSKNYLIFFSSFQPKKTVDNFSQH
jgi:hypothetical protein